MKLQQLRYLIAIADNNLSFTEAALKIHTSQPGLSKQLRLLEDELQTKLFERNGKQLIGLTPIGAEVIERSRKIIQEINNIKRLSSENHEADEGHLSIATTLTQAKYVLPSVLKEFHGKYQNIKIDLQQGSTDQILDMLKRQEIDFAIASGDDELGKDIIKIPCYQWDRVILFPQEHPLGDLKKISLEDVAQYPIVTYNIPNSVHSSLHKAFHENDLEPNIVFTARDSDIIKTYVKNGFGIGIIASMAFDPAEDRDLIGFSTENILPRSLTWIAFNKNLFIRKYMNDFIRIFAPHISEQELKMYIAPESLTEFELLDGNHMESLAALPLHAKK